MPPSARTTTILALTATYRHHRRGNRGIAYCKAIQKSTNGLVVGIAEPVAVKRRHIGRRFIWGSSGKAAEGQEFETWAEYVRWE